MPALFQELRRARADGSRPRLMARYARMNVIVIDDFGIAPLTDQDRQDLLELLDDRYDGA
jgi:DNA replication protein DnaC